MIQYALARRFGSAAILALALGQIAACGGNVPQANGGHPLAAPSGSQPLTAGSSRAGGSGTSGSQPPGGSGAQPTGSPSGQPASPPPATPVVLACTTTDLRGSVGSLAGVAGSNSYYPLVLTNVSGADCTLYGYPGVVMVTAIGGKQLGGEAVRNSALPTELITLAPGGAAAAKLQVANVSLYPASACRPAKANFLRVYPPGQFSALYVSFAVETCTKPIPGGSTLGIYVLRPGTSG